MTDQQSYSSIAEKFTGKIIHSTPYSSSRVEGVGAKSVALRVHIC